MLPVLPYLHIPTFGFFMALAFWAAYGVFTLELRRHQRAGTLPAAVHIRQLMDQLLIWCSLIGFAGAFTLGGFHELTYYGGLIFGALTYLFILHRRGISLPTAADIGSPGMMLAYAIGRMGCHLAGDGDWGIVNRAAKPGWLSWMPDWAWASRYPNNVIRTVLPEGVFPTPLYESLVCLLLFTFLWSIRRRVTTPGLLFFIYALLTGTERFLVEYIRVTPRHHFAGWTLTQAQFISLGLIGIGMLGTSYILTTSAKKAYFYR